MSQPRHVQPYVGPLAQLYDVAVPDWPGEIAFYGHLAAATHGHPARILELACGTGRIAHRLAEQGHRITGIDLSEEMLCQAREKTTSGNQVRWLCADMRSFQLSETFDLILVPAYSFQLLLSEADQLTCLGRMAEHLAPSGRAVLHLESYATDWLDSLPTDGASDFEVAGEAVHPNSAQRIRVAYAWSYASCRAVVTVHIRYETLSPSGDAVERSMTDSLQMACLQPDHVSELLCQVGLNVESLHADFLGHPYTDTAEELVLVAALA